MRSEWWEYEPCAAKLSIARVLVDDQQGPDAIGATTRGRKCGLATAVRRPFELPCSAQGEDAAAPSEVILAAWNAHRLGAIETLTNVARCPCAWEWAGSLRIIYHIVAPPAMLR